jgi:hypothetical protein
MHRPSLPSRRLYELKVLKVLFEHIRADAARSIRPAIIATALFSFCALAPAFAAEQKNAESPAKSAAPPAPAAIALADIAARATQVATIIADLNTRAAPSPQIETIGRAESISSPFFTF